MRVLLIGGNGQLGKSITDTFKNDNMELIAPNSDILNLLDNDSINKTLTDINPDIVVNCAGYTNVDKAEIDSKKAVHLNTEAPKNLAIKIEEIQSFLIQISTDYVFGKSSSGPFSHHDETDPINIYGKTKRDAEIAIKMNTKNYLILRTASLVSKFDGNFVSSIIKKLLKKDKLKIIENQNISMTCSSYLAHGINSIFSLHKKLNLLNLSKNQIIHYTNYGYTDWYSIGKKIQERLFLKGLLDDNDNIKPIMASEWKSSAQRPIDSRLLLDDKTFNMLEIEQKKWEESLFDIIDEYLLLNGFIKDE